MAGIHRFNTHYCLCVRAFSFGWAYKQVIVKQGKDALTADSVFRISKPNPQPLLDLTQVEQLESLS